MVTGMDTVCPGSTTYGLMATEGLTLSCHRSPVGELTAGSKARVVAVIEVLARTGGSAFLPSGPCWNGLTIHRPLVTVRALSVPLALSPVTEENRSGSPKYDQ